MARCCVVKVSCADQDDLHVHWSQQEFSGSRLQKVSTASLQSLLQQCLLAVQAWQQTFVSNSTGCFAKNRGTRAQKSRGSKEGRGQVHFE